LDETAATAAGPSTPFAPSAAPCAAKHRRRNRSRKIASEHALPASLVDACPLDCGVDDHLEDRGEGPPPGSDQIFDYKPSVPLNGPDHAKIRALCSVGVLRNFTFQFVAQVVEAFVEMSFSMRPSLERCEMLSNTASAQFSLLPALSSLSKNKKRKANREFLQVATRVAEALRAVARGPFVSPAIEWYRAVSPLATLRDALFDEQTCEPPVFPLDDEILLWEDADLDLCSCDEDGLFDAFDDDDAPLGD
jgi:hypothetical protein